MLVFTFLNIIKLFDHFGYPLFCVQNRIMSLIILPKETTCCHTNDKLKLPRVIEISYIFVVVCCGGIHASNWFGFCHVVLGVRDAILTCYHYLLFQKVGYIIARYYLYQNNLRQLGNVSMSKYIPVLSTIGVSG